MQLNLLAYAQRLSFRNSPSGAKEVWCPIRKSWLKVQPEELVRQALIHYLETQGYPTNLMQAERKVGFTRDRLDLLVLDRRAQPFMLVEVKAPGYPLQPAIDQLARYNQHWKAPHVLAVNGEEAILCSLDFEAEQIRQQSELPAYPVDKSA